MKANFITTLALSLILGLIHVAAGADDGAPSPSKFDVSDVSFLIPPGNTSISVAGSDRRAPLLRKEIFVKFIDFVERGHPNLNADQVYENLVVTGIRFDPCGPKYPPDWDAKKCTLPNLRVIAQVLKDDGQPTNAALHMVFMLRDLRELKAGKPLDPALRDDVMNRLTNMKNGNTAAGISTNGIPAGIHPIFKVDRNTTPRVAEFEAELLDLLLKHCDENRYFFTAVMFTDQKSVSESGGSQQRWVWQKGNIVRKPNDAGGVDINLVFGGIPGMDPQIKEQTFTANTNSRDDALISPRSTITNDGNPNANIEAILRKQADFVWGDLQKAVDATEVVENPDRVLVQTDDCVSCHVSSTSRLYALRDRRLTWVKHRNAFQFLADRQLTTRMNPEDIEWQQRDEYSVMAFAYFDGRPSINQRTINESLQAAHLVNLLRQ